MKLKTIQPRSEAERILTAAARHIGDRAASRDMPDGERSMAAAVAAFNALEFPLQEGGLSEVQGWRFMAVLKLARAAKGKLNVDDYEDGAAYMALAAEAAQREQHEASTRQPADRSGA